ncbi:ankyrin repeat domain-containing protein [Paraurantiacibacter namhicola]|uniref:Ankyrin repeats (3 copies) n=1 Tax=Paraurantiacibacter namhicola TaxID=645517 RepID=A0A1C7D6V0_9SPHN|nr:ankyrin repeat domain-containing protein [Paraurantiacibacter namhicola]ANU07178.1 Ankyrin repeats (3 copies) [Paraurantiacibacter namhicola]
MFKRFRLFGLVGLFLSTLMGASLASAQGFSDGFLFLEAVEKRDAAKVNELLEHNATIVNSRDLAKGHTGLHIATKRRDLQWMGYLLGKGADPDIADKNGVTPLMVASQLGFVEGVELLSSKGANVDIPNSAGETPLISAVHRRDLSMVRVLLRGGADPDRNDNSGRSARDYATLGGPGNSVLSEIDRLGGEPGSRTKKKASTYGPSF